MDIKTLFMLLLVFVLLFYNQYKRIKDEKTINQLQADYNSLLQTVTELTHENNILKNQSADTK